MVEKERFEIKEEHLKLLRSMCVDWDDCEFGAPRINPKRPYGNSDVHEDMVEILGWKGVLPEDDEFVWLPEEITKKLDKLHKETETALQICLYTQTFETGIYETKKYHNEWNKVK